MEDHLSRENIAETIARNVAKPQVVNDGFTDTTQPTLIGRPTWWATDDMTKQVREAMEWLAPMRRRGTAVFESADSLVAWTNRHKAENSVIFATIDGEAPGITAIIDYHHEGPTEPTTIDDRCTKARHGKHRGAFPFPMSEEWRRWTRAAGKPMGMAEFGEFIEENAKDVLDPTPYLLGNGKMAAPWEERMVEVAQRLGGRFGSYAVLQNLANSFKVVEAQNVEVKINRDSGEAEVQFLTQHKQPDGQPVKVPNLFMVAIPVFQNGVLWRVPVRFRYRKAGGEITFTLSLHDADTVRRKAMMEVVEFVLEQTALPLFLGKPET